MLRQIGLGSMPGPMTSVPSITRSFVEQQIDMYEVMMKQAPVAAFLRQQALMIDLALSALKMQKTWRKRS
ncbi:MAG: hypothetical protein ACR2O4_14490 [Hyphomicrobiaceae bacterium]